MSVAGSLQIQEFIVATRAISYVIYANGRKCKRFHISCSNQASPPVLLEMNEGR